MNNSKPFIDTLEFGVCACFKLEDIRNFGFKKQRGISVLNGLNNFSFRYFYGDSFFPCLKMNGSLPKVVTGSNVNHSRSIDSRIKYLYKAEEALLPFSPISLSDFLLNRVDVTLDINCNNEVDKHNLINLFKNLSVKNIKEYETGVKIKSSNAYGFSATVYDKGEETMKSGVYNQESSNTVRLEFKFSKQYLKNTFKRLQISRNSYDFLLNEYFNGIVNELFEAGLKSFERKMPKNTWYDSNSDKKYQKLVKYNKFFAEIYKVLRPTLFDTEALLLYNILMRAENEQTCCQKADTLNNATIGITILNPSCLTRLGYLETPKINDSG